MKTTHSSRAVMTASHIASRASSLWSIGFVVINNLFNFTFLD